MTPSMPRPRTLRLVILIAAVALAGAVGSTAANMLHGGDQPRTKVIQQTQLPTTKSPSTLVEAWEIADALPRGWSGTWAITGLRSVDVNDTPSALDGSEGRRRTWQAEYRGDSGMIRWARITDGAVTDVIEPAVGPSKAAPLYRLARPAMDSTDAIRVAREARPQFQGALGAKATGFHFAYGDQRVPGAEVVVVTGAVGQWPARVAVDTVAKQVVEAKEMQRIGGDLFVSADAGATWSKSELSGSAIAFGSDVQDASAIIYAIVDSGAGQALWASSDGARTWTRVAPLPDGISAISGALVVGPVRSAVRVTFAAEPGGTLWRFDTATRQFSKEPAPGPVKQIATDSAGRLHALVFSGDAGREYVADVGGELAIASPSNVTGFTRGNAAVQGFVQGQPYSGSRVANCVARWGDTILVSDGSGVSRSDDAGKTWTVSSLAAGNLDLAPDFSDSRVALAVSYEGIVSRSSDAGITWKQVGDVQGTNHGNVYFVSSAVAVIPTLGEFRWTDF